MVLQSEAERINELQKLFSYKSDDLICGIGDDCAVIKKTEDLYQVVSTDCLVEGVHFDLNYFTPQDLAHKSLIVNLSDIAAMGAKPLYFFLSLAIPPRLHSSFTKDFNQSLFELSESYQVKLLGGDLSSSQSSLFINITIFGEVFSSHCKFRKKAKSGDFLYVSGPLGLSALALEDLKKNPQSKKDIIKYHLKPQAKLSLGEFLGGQSSVTSLMDLSDGLIPDLKKLLPENYGAVLYYEQIPGESDISQKKLNGGEDYELLFTLSSESKESFLAEAQKAGFPLYEIGQIHSESNEILVLDAQGEPIELLDEAYEHFKSI